MITLSKVTRRRAMKMQTRDRILTALGLLGLAGFLYLYAVKLFGQHGKPPDLPPKVIPNHTLGGA
jgi:hypothetical protein